jgi:hypothetical protein
VREALPSFGVLEHIPKRRILTSGGVPMKTCMRTINAAMVAIVLVTSAAAQDSKCPVGLKYVGRLHYETNADNGHETKTVAFPVGIGLDPTYQQSNLKCSGGGSDARCDLTNADVPRGLHLAMSGDEAACPGLVGDRKGWAVNRPINLTALQVSGNTVEQFGFSANLSCTHGTNACGGCNVDVKVCAKLLTPPAKKHHPATGSSGQ